MPKKAKTTPRGCNINRAQVPQRIMKTPESPVIYGFIDGMALPDIFSRIDLPFRFRRSLTAGMSKAIGN